MDDALVVLTTSFPITGDGSEAAGGFVADFVEELAQHLPVRVVAPGFTDETETRSGRITVFRFKAPDKPLSTLKLRSPGDLFQIVHTLRSGERAVERAVRAGATRHILALWALPCGSWADSVGTRLGIPYSVWTLGSDIWTLGRIPLVRRRLRTVLRRAHHCWSDGFALADATSRIADRPVEFLPSTRRTSLSRTESARSEPPYRLVFIGRWHANKGVDLLVDALDLLEETDWQLIDRVDLYGGGPLESVVVRGAAMLERRGRPVFHHGFVGKEDAEAAMAAADYVLIPSRIESIPVVFSDAVKLGCPVIAMPVGDLPRLVGPGGCGFLADHVSAASFADAIRSALRGRAGDHAGHLAVMAEQFQLGRSAMLVMAALNGGAGEH